MTWMAASPAPKRLALPKKRWSTPACPHAAFDSGPTDPRTLVNEYQRLMRDDLFSELAEEVAGEERPSPWQTLFTACQDALATCEHGLRWLWLADVRVPAASQCS